MSIARNLAFLKNLPQLPASPETAVSSPLQRIAEFGANPGELAMWCYVPPNLSPGRPLVVVLHGCTQTATGFDHGSGWTSLAARHDFAVLMPEQQRTNNPNLCFNWFDTAKTARGGGEVLSIHRMIASMVRLHQVSPQHIFIVGLSAGGAMASAMLAAYPEVFEAGAIIAGLPHGVAGNLREALAAMATAQTRPDTKLGGLVRAASSHQGRWPRVSVWHGGADRVVNPANADQIVAQWRDVHGLPIAPSSEGLVDGRLRSVWMDAKGNAIIERYIVDGLGHGVPLALAGDGEVLGHSAPFMIDAGIASTRRIAEFFGIVKVSTPTRLESRKPEHQPSRPVHGAGIVSRVLAATGLIK